MTDIDILRTRDIRPVFELIPPTSDEFTVYGNAATVERARTWATNWRYLLARKLPACAHGIYLMDMCPSGEARCCEGFDHTDLWVPDRSPRVRASGDGAHTEAAERPFLLTSPYVSEIPQSVHVYARAHGLHVRSWPEFGDDWYGYGTLPIRLTLPESWPLWPIEREADAMFSVRPVSWPEDTPPRLKDPS